ncbi:FHA domain-containing protein [Mobilicoccus pelagius]|uniref:FHA domain-containing protein n=1 Tax=Mobilicoccus pelagius NBRC 104925 TaxID=1089455 RepID=H5UVV4_9MICO|nr:FHA domain-containing protein [Mobilicoccus pelagius]GAB49862.1 hypothetical protein MOPEL_135_01000 [Mobilicoccus pelagius NBRC 104925]
MRCPEGHESAATDYCDTCGAPMGAPGGATPAGVPDAGAAVPSPTPPPGLSTPEPDPSDAAGTGDAAAPATQTCPNCAAVNAADNLFCEVCGFDFTTGVMPRVEGGEPSFLDLPVRATSVAGDAADPSDVADETSPEAPRSDEEGVGALDLPAPPAAAAARHEAPDEPGTPVAATAADPRAAEAAPGSTPGATPEDDDESPDADAVAAPHVETPTPPAPPVAAPPQGDLDPAVPDASAPAGHTPAPTPGLGSDSGSGSGSAAERGRAHPPTPAPGTSSLPSAEVRPVNRPPSREVAGDWVVEVWIDPDWFAVQDADEAYPSPAPPEVVRLTRSDALVGRRSRTSVPDVDCGIDSAVSRRQALLTSDGRRWWIEDLDSSNGTWVGPAIGPLPRSPISGRTEIDADDRIYVGAWTRLVVRPAVESEVHPD